MRRKEDRITGVAAPPALLASCLVGSIVNPKTRHTGAGETAHALPSIRRVEAMQVLLAIVAVALTIGSAVLTKRTAATPAPLASVSLQNQAHMTPGTAHREHRGIPAVSLVSKPNAIAPSIVDPTRQSTREAPIIASHTNAPESTEQATELTSGDDQRFVTPPAGYERYYNGRPLRRARTMMMTVTAYSPDHRSCGKYADGITASGMSVWTNGMNLVAADPRVLPRHSLITVPGYADDAVVPVLDVGGAIKGRRLDVLYPSHAVATQWGVRRLEIIVWEYADE